MALSTSQIIYLVIFIAVLYSFYKESHPEKLYNINPENANLLKEGPLLDGTGNLIQSGWAPHPTYAVKSSEIGHVLFGIKELSFLRYKHFEFHLLQSQTDLLFFFWGNSGSFAGSVTLAHYNMATKKMQVDENVITDFRELFPLSDQTNIFKVKDFSCAQNGLSINFSDSEHSNHFERHFKLKSEKLNFQGEFTYFKAKKDEGHF